MNEHGKKAESNLLSILLKYGSVKLISNSGAGKFLKGDLAFCMKKADGNLDFLIECKSTIHDSAPLKIEVFRKIRNEANPNDKIPLLVHLFVNSDGKINQGIACIDLKLLLELLAN